MSGGGEKKPSEELADTNCVVCCREVSIYAIGECDHPVCFECATRMRVLSRQNECPICRRELPKILFVKNRRQYADVANMSFPLRDRKYNLYFEDASVRQAHCKLLEHRCHICENEPSFATFVALKDHVRKTHELFFCDICIKHLLIFTGERKCYTRQELATHRRRGDVDDTSHRGHPLCEFCNDRFLDDDELFRHLRREHFFCHFCDTDGHHHYYSDYEYLRKHFRAEHFLCEEGECLNEKFTTAFRSEIDLKAHRATVHNKGLTKAQSKQARTLELEFSIAPRGAGNSEDIPSRGYFDADDSSSRRGRRRGGGGGYGNSHRGGAARDYPQSYSSRYDDGDGTSEPVSVAQNPAVASPNINMNSSQDFPVLGLAANGVSRASSSGTAPTTGSTPDTLARKLAKINRFTVGSGLGDEEFPALHSAKAPAPSKIASKFKGSNTWGTSGSATLSLTSSQAPAQSSVSRNTLTVKLNSQDEFPGLLGTKKQRAAPKVSIQVDHKQKAVEPPSRPSKPPERQPVVTRMASSQNITFINPPASVQPRSEPNAREPPPADQKQPRPPDFADGLPKTDGGWYVLKKGKAAKSKSPPVEARLTELTLDEDFPSLAGRSTPPPRLKKEPPRSNSEQPRNGSEPSTKNSWRAAPSKDKPEPSEKAPTKAKPDPSERTSAKNGTPPPLSATKTKKKKKAGDTENATNGAASSDNNKVKNGPKNDGNDAAEGQDKKIKRAELRLEAVAPTARDAEKPQPAEKKQAFCADDFPGLEPRRAAPVKRRTELKVEPLAVPAARITATTKEVQKENARNGQQNGVTAFTDSDFPDLGAPPGFGKLAGRPPPGFAPTIIPEKKPPPGFGALQPATEFSFPAAPVPSRAYAQPEDAQRRNRELAERLRGALGGDEAAFGRFKDISAGFRTGALAAADYYQQCVELMGRPAFAAVFPELLALLPDIGRQQELLAVHGAAGQAAPFMVCASCQQVLAAGDFRAHEAGHGLDSFPALGELVHTSSISWVKRK